MKQKNYLLYIAYTLLGISFVVMLVFIYIVISENALDGIISMTKDAFKNNFGDTMTGTIGILLSFASTLFLFITFKEQRKQFVEAEKTQEVAKFEQTFFNIMSLLSDVRRTTTENLRNHNFYSIEGYYYDFCNFFQNKLQDSKILNSYFKELEKLYPLSSVVVSTREEIGNIYKEYVDDNWGNIGYFFRYIYNTLKFVKDQDGKIINKQRYINLLQSQLSDEELCLIFYDAISPYGMNKNGDGIFYKLLEESEMLENINENVLIEKSHAKIYPSTKFKFLSRRELAVVEDRRKANLVIF